MVFFIIAVYSSYSSKIYSQLYYYNIQLLMEILFLFDCVLKP